jgi:hypothetical protein
MHHKLIATNPKVAMIHASLDDTAAEAVQWARQGKFPWFTILSDEHEATGLLALSGDEVPETILIDKSGNVLTRDEDEAFAKLAALK